MGVCQTKQAVEPSAAGTSAVDALVAPATVEKSPGQPGGDEHPAVQQRKKLIEAFHAIKIAAPDAVVVSNPDLKDVDSKSAMFNTLKYGFNRRFTSDASWILTCRCTQDVVNAVQLCARYGMRPTVGSGYHCYEDFVVSNPTGMLIDVSMMDNISTTKQLATSESLVIVEPGTYNWKIALHLFKLFGKLLPGGSCYSVCAGGHICGGGYGINSRLHGLTVDYIQGVEIVVVDAEGIAKAVTVTKDTEDEKHKDLLWACTGGGGQQLGIITKYYFKENELPSAPMEDVYLTNISVSWKNQKIDGENKPGLTREQFGKIIDAYGKFWNGEGKDSYFDLFTLCHTQHYSFNNFNIVVCANKYESMKAFLNAMHPVLHDAEITFVSNPVASFGLWHTHFVGLTPPEPGHPDLEYNGFHILKFPWLTSTQYCNGNPSNSRFKNTGAYHTKPFTKYMVDILYKYLTMDMSKDIPYTVSGNRKKDQTWTTSSAQVQIDSYGGNINKVSPGATAVPQRSSIMKLQYQVYWDHEENDDINLWWITNFEQEMYRYCPPEDWKPEFNEKDTINPNLKTNYGGAPFPNVVQGTAGCYINYPDICIGTLQKSYAPLYWPDYETYHRLQVAKQDWDPQNHFNFKQCISRADEGDGLGPMLPKKDFEYCDRPSPYQ